ncbi:MULTISPECIES: hypothetical protein [Sphingomonas]|uniref:hypothetical protein n=1 Tax=Sphingomonas TaxID=13687 RepID=UPI00254D107D|nr:MULTISPECIES: hypothetical protein [Sphingomonas]MDK8184270.1 hypothetical protein [Sphingomonas zeae]MDK8214641.1 hypothetical protein [Sphingomonas sp. UMB7805-LC452B]
MFDTTAAARSTVLALIGTAPATDQDMERAATSRARAAHDRIDTLLLGRPAAARKRVHRLFGITGQTSQVAPTVPVALPREEGVAVEHASRVRARVAALLAPAA